MRRHRLAAARARRPDPRLTWAPPALTSPTTISLHSGNRRAILTPGLDYIIDLGSTPISVSGGIEIIGGRNVVLIGGHINIAADYSSGYPSTANLAFKLQGNTTEGGPPQHLHIEGVRISSTDPGYIADVIYYQANKDVSGTLTLQNVLVDGLSYGWEQNADLSQGPHADIIQVIGGPSRLRIDRMTAIRAGYQGFFLQMNQSAPSGRVPGDPVLRRVNLRPSTGEVPTGMTYPSGGRYGLYLTNTEIAAGRRVICDDVWIAENPSYQGSNPWYPESGYGSWLVGDVHDGVPPHGDFVTLSDAGIGYVSPGYRESE